MTAPSLLQGQIVWVVMTDPNGQNPKDRPAVITTPTAEIATFGTVEVVAITSRVGDAPADVSVPIPWMRGGHPRTKLDRASVAVANWYALFPISDVRPTAGRVPFQEMSRILSTLAALKGVTSPPSAPPVPPTPPASAS